MDDHVDIFQDPAEIENENPNIAKRRAPGAGHPPIIDYKKK